MRRNQVLLADLRKLEQREMIELHKRSIQPPEVIRAADKIAEQLKLGRLMAEDEAEQWARVWQKEHDENVALRATKTCTAPEVF